VLQKKQQCRIDYLGDIQPVFYFYRRQLKGSHSHEPHTQRCFS
jgi:hypothetical protein